MFDRRHSNSRSSLLHNLQTIDMLRLTVIIPVYNRQALAERALASVTAQNVDDLDIIVVDDASQPPFRLPASPNANIRLIRHDSNTGAGPARARGVAAAQSDWITFLDSDDYWLPGSLRPRLELAQRNFTPEQGPMTAYAAGFESINKQTGRSEIRMPRSGAGLRDFASGCWFSPGSTLLIPKAAFARVGAFDPTLRRLEDFDWFLRFGLAGGRLDIWPGVAAAIEIGAKPQYAVLQDAVARLRAKYVETNASMRLTPAVARRVSAYLDLEFASSCAARRQWLTTLYYLARSFLKVPRLTLHLKRFWDIRKSAINR